MRKSNKYGNMSKLSVVYNVIVCVTLIAFSISLIIPLAWAVNASFKDIIDYTLNPMKLPKPFTFNNYKSVWNMLYVDIYIPSVGLVRYGLKAMLINTFMLAFTKPILSTLFTFFSAYAIAKCNIVGGKFIYNFGIVWMIVPIIGTFPTQMALMHTLNWYDNILIHIITNSTGAFMGLNFLMFYASLKQINNGYAEAAEIDGASEITILFKIVFPMVTGTFFMFVFLGFLGVWNDYYTSLVWLPSHPTIAYGMYIFREQKTHGGSAITMPEILSAFILLMIPTVILYLSIQNLIITKLQIGGLKG